MAEDKERQCNSGEDGTTGAQNCLPLLLLPLGVAAAEGDEKRQCNGGEDGTTRVQNCLPVFFR